LRLFPELTAFENIKLKNNLTGFKTDNQIKDMFEILGVADKLDSTVAKMSWGQQQRVAIIRCFCQSFDFLILDEPISHLDDENADIMASLVDREASAQGAGVIVTSIGKHLPLNYIKKQAL
ncbi:MAG TPA: ABC transporter ATP-binding protein, partial [Dysgonomonas sp.]|nr:ABC transporter ATP-binding protein [Dysgonomonas sp.]